MSSKNRKTKSVKNDNYPTPPAVIEHFIKNYDLPAGEYLDPCAGDGAFVRITQKLRPDIIWMAQEIRPECQAPLELLLPPTKIACGPQHGDFLNSPNLAPGEKKHTAVFSNPPYTLAMNFINKSLTVARYTIFLLRLNFLGSKKRAKFFKNNMPDVYVVSQRPQFKTNSEGKKGTDSTEYAFFVWDAENPKTVGQVRVIGYPGEEE